MGLVGVPVMQWQTVIKEKHVHLTQLETERLKVQRILFDKITALSSIVKLSSVLQKCRISLETLLANTEEQHFWHNRRLY